MARSGRSVGALIRLALLVTALVSIPWGARAQRRVDTALPSCSPAHIDRVLLVELLAIELGAPEWAGALELSIDPSFCDEAGGRVTFEVHDVASGVRARDAIALPSEPDRGARTRAIALAIAERTALVLSRAHDERQRPAGETSAAETEAAGDVDPVPSVDPRSAATGVEATSAAPPVAPTALASVVRSERSIALSSPTGVDPGRRGGSEPREPASAAIDVAPLVRFVPRGDLSWAVGATGAARWIVDGPWTVGADARLTWSHADTLGANVEVGIGSIALRGGVTFLRDRPVEMWVVARAELGVLFAGGAVDGFDTTTIVNGWSTLGARLGLALWVGESIAWVLEAGADVVLLGSRVEAFFASVDLTDALIETLIGLRLAI
jgi:hypothetical protein